MIIYYVINSLGFLKPPAHQWLRNMWTVTYQHDRHSRSRSSATLGWQTKLYQIPGIQDAPATSSQFHPMESTIYTVVDMTTGTGYAQTLNVPPITPLTFCVHLCSDTAGNFRPADNFGSTLYMEYTYIFNNETLHGIFLFSTWILKTTAETLHKMSRGL